MVEVADEPEKGTKNDADAQKEEQKQEQKEEQKEKYQDETDLMQIQGVYRVKEWRLEQQNDFLITNIFEFTDQTGEGQIIKISVTHDKTIEPGRSTIKPGNQQLKVFTKTLADLEQMPEPFTF